MGLISQNITGTNKSKLKPLPAGRGFYLITQPYLMHIILTGATGTLGSQFIFTLLEKRFKEIQSLWVIVRPKNKVAPTQRIKNMLRSAIAPVFVQNNLEAILTKIKVIDAQNALRPYDFLNPKYKYYFIHSAGYVNLSVKPEHETEIFAENLTLTQNIFKAYLPYLKKFIYISTAFSIGKQAGILTNNYFGVNQNNYRNYYEAAKHAAEKHLVQAGKTSGVDVQILRPSVLGGNITQAPCYFISKYMVFYLFAKFFDRNSTKDLVRIEANPQSQLNIIPTDYVAKVICKVFDTAVAQLNIVNQEGTKIVQGITKILEAVNFKNYELTTENLSASTHFKSSLERFYYETIGIHLTPYLTAQPNQWDTQALDAIVPLPKYNPENYLTRAITYAKRNKFKNQRW